MPLKEIFCTMEDPFVTIFGAPMTQKLFVANLERTQTEPKQQDLLNLAKLVEILLWTTFNVMDMKNG